MKPLQRCPAGMKYNIGAAVLRNTAAWDNNRYDSDKSVSEDLPAGFSRYAWSYRHMEVKATYVPPYHDRDTIDLAVEMGKTIWYTRMTAYFNVAVGMVTEDKGNRGRSRGFRQNVAHAVL